MLTINGGRAGRYKDLDGWIIGRIDTMRKMPKLVEGQHYNTQHIHGQQQQGMSNLRNQLQQKQHTDQVASVENVPVRVLGHHGCAHAWSRRSPCPFLELTDGYELIGGEGSRFTVAPFLGGVHIFTSGIVFLGRSGVVPIAAVKPDAFKLHDHVDGDDIADLQLQTLGQSDHLIAKLRDGTNIDVVWKGIRKMANEGKQMQLDIVELHTRKPNKVNFQPITAVLVVDLLSEIRLNVSSNRLDYW